MRTNGGSSGFTILEMLIALSIMTFVVLGGYQFLSRFSSMQTDSQSDLLSHQDLEQLLTMVETEWRYRIQPDSASFSTSPAPFNASAQGLTQCTNLSITQRDVSNPAVQTTKYVQFVTSCAGPASPNTAGMLVHPDINCPGYDSQVAVFHGATQYTVYPLSQTGAAAALCFRADTQAGATVISVEAGMLVGNGKQAHILQSRRVLTTLDRGPGVELTH